MVDTSKYAATFELIDADGDGLVSAAELKELMTRLGDEVTDETAAQAVEIIDGDGDGLVSLDELAGYLESRAAPGSASGS